MNALQDLPSKGQTFSSIRRQNLLYVDKTRPIHEIISTGGCCFLSRPRRFGKSLLLGTMAEIFRGRRELFQGLWIGSPECGHDFIEYPVVHMSLAVTSETPEGLMASLAYKVIAAAKENQLNLSKIATRDGLNFEAMSPGDMLDLLVRSLREKTGQNAVILIDEYDAPILGVIGDVGQAMKNRDVLRGFYSALKTLADQDYVHFMFVTGLTKFAKASIFSVFNNLKDLTLDPRYADICGFTVPEFDARLAAYLPGALENVKSRGKLPRQTSLGEFRGMVLDFYDGYSWDGETRVLNPFSLVNFLD
ncbi:MAG: AAA family ATPase, partial [Deltaproteobacteria bacterium]|nr:AAA family ATPase [Deltaproteobacteria bacterium]